MNTHYLQLYKTSIPICIVIVLGFPVYLYIVCLFFMLQVHHHGISDLAVRPCVSLASYDLAFHMCAILARCSHAVFNQKIIVHCFVLYSTDMNGTCVSTRNDRCRTRKNVYQRLFYMLFAEAFPFADLIESCENFPEKILLLTPQFTEN